MGSVFSRLWSEDQGEIFNRRKNHRLQPDHPEENTFDETTIIETSIDVAETLSTDTCMTPLPILDDGQKNTLPEGQASRHQDQYMLLTKGPIPLKDGRSVLIKCSEFYRACRIGDVTTVRNLLQKLTQDEIDQVEPNGSTALHAAAYHGQTDIVRLLLERGADRSIKNKYDCVPFDEAANEAVKELFLRTPNANRLQLETGNIEWEMIVHDALDSANEERKWIQLIYTDTLQEKMFDKIEKNYIKKYLIDCANINKIVHFFEKATRYQDPIWIIKAYTAETDFYNVLNAELAAGATKCQTERRYVVALLMYHPKLDRLTYIGISYRVMKVTEHDLNRYVIGSQSKIKSFLSSTINEKIAIGFLCRQERDYERNGIKTRIDARGRIIKSWIMCKYHVKHRRTALHIENSSQYAEEGEVLIMPYTVFKIKSKRLYDIKDIPQHERIWMFEFEECDGYATS